MAYSVQKSRLAKVAGVSLVLLLAACSSDSRYKRQVSGDEAYLQASPLSELAGETPGPPRAPLPWLLTNIPERA